ncbi:LLM class flavin-dependent oxidoreductase [Rhodococcus fascians]|nr:LLM class flavin-dependent oxidoreductase [Rhodococcus fascians]MBY4238741.1 LLM class flavin-dependent oxidoreductase [Rhodococcus fascians]MBY4254670.1 LLM class flavin-dependent oxidoreductase [Rhodococcus fascians]MBY4270096.1 LLM class flavin-dependent oxidoreductase [Rhodococcus fascians]
MKFGILLTSIYDGTVDPAQQRLEHEELAKTADSLGFDVMVAGQHFLGAELRYFQPVPWLAHLSHAAPRMQTATGIVLLSMVNPIDMAEQMSTLDVVTDGKAIFGIGLGYSPHEFDAFGVAKGTKVRRFEESLTLIKKLWSGETVDFDGEFVSVTGARPAVQPIQKGGPPIWIGGQATNAIKRAARMADAWYAPPFPNHSELRTLRSTYLETRADSGLPLDGDFPVRRELVLGESKDSAREAAIVRYQARYKTYLKWGLSGENTPKQLTGQELADDIDSRFILGTPNEVVDGLAKIGEDTGMTHFVYKPHWPGLPHREAMAQLEQFGTDVMPKLTS